MKTRNFNKIMTLFTPLRRIIKIFYQFNSANRLQGIWLDDDTETALWRVSGDTIYYADATTLPVAFKVLGDSLVTYGTQTNAYKIEKQGEYIFWFYSAVGDVFVYIRPRMKVIP